MWNPFLLGLLLAFVGWYAMYRVYRIDSCSIERETSMSCELFVSKYLGKAPVVLRNTLLLNREFTELTSIENVRESIGHFEIKLSTANSFTGRDWTSMTVNEYLAGYMKPQTLENQGNETFYLFGSTDGDLWEEFLSRYVRPTTVYPSETLKSLDPCALSAQKEWTALSFGIAGLNSGVPFHFHGPGFLQVLHGRKEWYLYPPDSHPLFHPNESTYFWYSNVLPTLKEAPTHRCILEPGDVIYFPDRWLHATLNLDEYTAFIATFA